MTLLATTPLSVALQEGTACAHAHAERAPFMSVLLDGGLTVAAFASYTGQLHAVYVALERAARAAAATPVMGALHDPRLERVAALESDLAELCGPQWRDVIHALPETRAYADHLDSLSGDGASALAHHYVRYMGDLSGGQIIARLAGVHYGLEPRHLSFYDFSGLGKVKPYRDAYRRQLDGLELRAEERETVLAEANRAFDLNFAMLAALGARHGLA